MKVSEQELRAAGFTAADNDGILWHWTGSPGIAISDGQFMPCDAFSNGELQYAEIKFDDFTTAAKYAINYFS